MENAKTQKQFADEVKKAPTTELVAFYNKRTGKSIKKFSSREAAERQCIALFVASGSMFAKSDAEAAAAPTEKVDSILPVDVIDTGRRDPDHALEGRRHQERRGTAVAPKPEKAPRKESAPSADRAEAIKKSWENPDVKEARSTRHTVWADKVEYRSLRQAFVELKLPLKDHIKFRMELKAKGKAIYHGISFRAEER